jgi:cytochrome P450
MDRLTPLSAVTAPDPYPFYAALVARRPFYRADTPGMWIASSAEAVEAVLGSPAMRTRPPAEPVPRAIAGTAVADVFSRMVRWNDGRPHEAVKPALRLALKGLDSETVAATSERCARLLTHRSRPTSDPDDLSAYAFSLYPTVMASLLGFRDEALVRAAGWTRNFARSFVPSSAPDDVARGIPAVMALRGSLEAALGAHPPGSSFAPAFVREARSLGADDMTIAANLVGLFSQGYDATAGLIATTLTALFSTQRGHLEHARGRAEFLAGFIAEVARHDSPVQNTRRFAAVDVDIMGATVPEGDAVLVVFAAANRDPARNSRPDQFDPFRNERVSYTFGVGTHACPGAAIAITIACAGVQRLLDTGIAPEAVFTNGYLPSANARIPSFRSPAIAR